MNIYKEYLNRNKIEWLKEGLVFVAVSLIVLVGIMISTLIIGIGDYSEYFEIANHGICNIRRAFGSNVKKCIAANYYNPKGFFGFFGQIINNIASVYFVLGFYVFWIKFVEMWSRSAVDSQVTKYSKNPKNFKVTYKLITPKGFDPSPLDHKKLILYIFEMMKSNNVTIESMLNQGRQYQEMTFDYITKNGNIDTYITFPVGLSSHIKEAFGRYFGEIELASCKDPFLEYRKFQSKNPKLYDNSKGFCFSLVGSNVNPPMPLVFVDYISDPVKQLLGSYKTTHKDQIIIMQYNFVFDTNIDYKKYNNEFDKYLQAMYSRYSVDNKKETDASDSLFPREEKIKIDSIFSRLKSIWIGTSIRVLTIPPNSVGGGDFGTLDSVESELRAYFEKSKLPIEINYLTSTNQSYYRYNVAKVQPEMRSIYETYYYGPEFLESFLAPRYERYYFPKENNLRRRVLIDGILGRKSNSPLSHKFFYMDPEAFSRYMYLGKVD